ncbi:MAG: hypothetical protein AB1714_00715 [Acidobacteriota bacterium]
MSVFAAREGELRPIKHYRLLAWVLVCSVALPLASDPRLLALVHSRRISLADLHEIGLGDLPHMVIVLVLAVSGFRFGRNGVKTLLAMVAFVFLWGLRDIALWVAGLASAFAALVAHESAKSDIVNYKKWLLNSRASDA